MNGNDRPGTPSSSDPAKRHSRALGLGLTVAALGVATALVAGPRPGGREAAADVSQVRPNPESAGTAIHALAHLEPASGFVSVGTRPGSRIDQILVKEGDTIKRGDLLAVLEGRDQAQRQLALAEAKKKDSDRQRSLRRDRLAVERELYDRLKQPRLDAAQKSARIARQRFQQSSDLYKKLGQTLERDPKARFDLDQTYFQLELTIIKAELDEQELRFEQEIQEQRRRLEDREIADDGPGQETLERQIELAKGTLAETEVRAPSPGRVLEILAHVGEISAGPLLLLGDDSAMVAKAEVYQTDVPRISIGDPADVRVLDRTLAGKVAKIARIVGRNELKSQDPRALQDLRVIRVTIALDDPGYASHFMSMQVDVTIRLKSAASK